MGKIKGELKLRSWRSTRLDMIWWGCNYSLYGSRCNHFWEITLHECKDRITTCL